MYPFLIDDRSNCSKTAYHAPLLKGSPIFAAISRLSTLDSQVGFRPTDTIRDSVEGFRVLQLPSVKRLTSGKLGTQPLSGTIQISLNV
jgi:hypothetical protein